MIGKFFNFLLGVMLSIIIGIFGALFAYGTEEEGAMMIPLISIPIIGFIIYREKHKSIGLGMIISGIPLIALGIVFVILSSLH